MREEHKKRIERVFAILSTCLIVVGAVAPIACGADFLINDYDGVVDYGEYTSTQGNIYIEISNEYAGNDYVEYIKLTDSQIPILKNLDVDWNGKQDESYMFDISYGEYLPGSQTIKKYLNTNFETATIGPNEVDIKQEEYISLQVIKQESEAEINSIMGADNYAMNCVISLRDMYVWNESITNILGNNTSVKTDILTHSDVSPRGNNYEYESDVTTDNSYTDEDGHYITETRLWTQWTDCTIKYLGETETEEATITVEYLSRIDQTAGHSLGNVIRWSYPQAKEKEIYKIVEANIPININAQGNNNDIDLRVKTQYTTIQNIEDIILKIAEEDKLIMPDSIDIGGWLATSITGFMEAEIGMGITIGGILIMFIAFNSVIWLLKLFAGG